MCAPAGNAMRIDSVSATAEAVAAVRCRKARREIWRLRGLRVVGSVMVVPVGTSPVMMAGVARVR